MNCENGIIDDGLYTPEIGAWGEEKYKLVHTYAKLFATSMKNTWQCRVYIDLFAGAGRSKIRTTNKIVLSSPLLALEIIDRFDKYVFCEKDTHRYDALEKRIAKSYKDVDISLIHGDANEQVEVILKAIPKANRSYKVICFCFVDPFKVDNLKFETIKRLSKRFVDFLVLIPTGMDIKRNLASYYFKKSNCKVDDFLGDPMWREKWNVEKQKPIHFTVDQFGINMTKLNYLYLGSDKTVPIYENNNRLLYHLAFFSQNKLGEKFWAEVKKYCQPQGSLF